MKTVKYISRQDIEKLQNFYRRAKAPTKKRAQRIAVLEKNLQHMSSMLNKGHAVLEEDAYPAFAQMTKEFFILCRKEGKKLPYSLYQSVRKVQLSRIKENYKLEQKLLQKEHEIDNLIAQEKRKFSYLDIYDKAKSTLKKAANYMLIGLIGAGSVFLRSGAEKTSLDNKDKKKDKTQITVKPFDRASVPNIFFGSLLNEEITKMEAQKEKDKAIADNEKNYNHFIDNLLAQYMENISTLQNRKTNRRAFYREQAELIEKFGKFGYIAPQSSCESMSYATFLRVLEDNKVKDNYVVEACEQILADIPNPHACISSKSTLENAYSANLEKSIEQELERNPKGIYMLWIKTEQGSLHRMTVIGTGEEAYLLAYNNNCIVKMPKDKLSKLKGYHGYYCNFGKLLKEKSGDLLEQNFAKEEKSASKPYIAFLYRKQQQR